MSQYASAAELKAIGLPPGAVKNFSDEQLEPFLTNAAALIDSFLSSGGYPLPIGGALGPPNTFPPQLTRANICIARYDFMVYRGFVPDEYDQNFRQTYLDCLEYLEKLASGTVTLPSTGSDPEPPGPRPLVATKVIRNYHGSSDAALVAPDS